MQFELKTAGQNSDHPDQGALKKWDDHAFRNVIIQQ
jgi:hypothetical protein